MPKKYIPSPSQLMNIKYEIVDLLCFIPEEDIFNFVENIVSIRLKMNGLEVDESEDESENESECVSDKELFSDDEFNHND